MPISARERQQKHRTSLRENGNLRTSVTLTKNALAVLRKITAEHSVTQSEAIELGLLVATKWLAESKKNA
ncbi:hypothetical protein [Atlantibacter subterraneus]|uniref:hypothetical protein n=1 Tax=Atlantibacter subterraneus TaxID=255519 RepID=UPI0028AF3044|nr:hypothetical protein [Atlantibacter subterranea]